MDWLRAFRMDTAVPVLISSAALALGCHSGSSLEEIRKLQDRGGFEASIEPIRLLLRDSQAEVASELNFRLGVALRRVGTPSQAVWPLAKASEDPDWFWAASIELAESALESGNNDLVLQTTSDMLEKNNAHFHAWLLSAEARIASQNDLEQALVEAETALALQRDSYVARLTQASVLLMLGRAAAAEEVIVAVEELAGSNELGEGELGRLCAVRSTLAFEMGEQELAQTRIEDCLKRFPAQPSVIETASTLFRAWQQPTRALEVLAKAVEVTPSSLPFRIALATYLREEGKIDEAGNTLRMATTLPHESQRQAAWSALADHFLSLKQYADAAEAMGQSLALDPEPDSLDLLAHADLLAMAGDHVAARQAAKRMDRAEFRDLVEGRILLQEQKPEQALEALDRAMSIWPDNAAARYYAARAAEQAGNVPRAIAEYRHSIRADAGFTDAGLRLARFHLAQGSIPAAIRAAQHHLNSHPADVESALLLARMWVLENQPIPADVLSRLSTARVTGRWAAMHARMLSDRGQTEAALALLDRATPRGSPETPLPEVMRAQIEILIERGRTQEARAQLEAWRDKMLDSAVLWEIEGVVLRADGKLREAQEAVSRAVKTDPESESAWRLLGEISHQVGDARSAIEAFERAANVSTEPWEPSRRAAEITIERGNLTEARSRLEALLREHPYDTRSIVLLARLCLDLTDCRSDVVDLARRAAFLGAPDDARMIQGQLSASRPAL